jgi:hypothetical protein
VQSFDAGPWVARCAARLLAHCPDDSPLDGTDWEDIARDLRETLGHLEPEAVAEAFLSKL